ncbi:oxygenase MpaB family protein [uncultured Gulosibacter sp.]|uniref:oxygenase MpaB family protein n=1 Tax=uncultured Gulosibacter sp. TaxID=1339167 RepID=UPI002888FB19|nr:oxygenase MpaB family protein [uncultured Gulosibacter sp.]
MSNQTRADDSPFRALASEAAVLAGGGTAILLQLAHPSVAAGVAQHSNFAAAPMRRLWGTLEYVTAAAFGNEAEWRFVCERVNRRHAAVTGETGTGEPYRADDTELQWWVAATLCWAAVRAHRRVYGGRVVNRHTADRIVRDFGRLGTGLRLPPETWPATAAEFDRRFAAALNELHITDEAMRAKRELFAARNAPLWLRAAMPYATTLAVDLLPPQIAAAYGHPATRIRRFIAALAWVPLIIAAHLLPPVIRALPARCIMRRVRRAAAAAR